MDGEILEQIESQKAEVFGRVFHWMTVMAIRTSVGMSLWRAWPSCRAKPWAVATLWDTYWQTLDGSVRLGL
jgi:hypothetical protein